MAETDYGKGDTPRPVDKIKWDKNYPRVYKSTNKSTELVADITNGVLEVIPLKVGKDYLITGCREYPELFLKRGYYKLKSYDKATGDFEVDYPIPDSAQVFNVYYYTFQPA